jgi:hypothetical protein
VAGPPPPEGAVEILNPVQVIRRRPRGARVLTNIL